MIDTNNLKPEAIFCLDISEYANQIERVCAEFILPAPKGIYIKNKLEPVLIDGRTYYTEQRTPGGITFVPITDINVVKCGVYDEEHKLLIPRMFMADKEKWVSNTPLLPYRGMKILELYVRDQLDNFVTYRKTGSYYLSKIHSHLKAPNTPQERHAMDCLIEYIGSDIYDSLWRNISEFFGNKNWNMYFIKVKDQFLTIERHCDWRIYDWTQRMESGEWK